MSRENLCYMKGNVLQGPRMNHEKYLAVYTYKSGGFVLFYIDLGKNIQTFQSIYEEIIVQPTCIIIFIAPKH